MPQALYVDDDNGVLMRLNVSDVSLLYRLRDEVLQGTFARKLEEALGARAHPAFGQAKIS